MTEPLSWIVGRGGMLGGALARALAGGQNSPTPGQSGFELALPEPLPWGTPDLAQRLASGAAELARRAQEEARPWRVCWCAGSAVVSSQSAELEREVESLRWLLEALAAQPALVRARGAFLLVSSAGGVHGAGGTARITERTAPSPVSAYGRAKLEQERILLQYRQRFAALSTLTARVSNLYGPSQRLHKRQGLISHMARAVIQGSPVQIYVPLDTTRDYLFVADAALTLATGVRRLEGLAEPQALLKLYAAERDTSIASLLGILRSIARRRLRVVAGLHRASAEQPRHLAFTSEVWPEDKRLQRTELIAGVGLVYRHLQRAYQVGSLPRP